MGFAQQQAVEAFMVSGKNEQLSVQYLLNGLGSSNQQPSPSESMKEKKPVMSVINMNKRNAVDEYAGNYRFTVVDSTLIVENINEDEEEEPETDQSYILIAKQKLHWNGKEIEDNETQKLRLTSMCKQTPTIF